MIDSEPLLRPDIASRHTSLVRSRSPGSAGVIGILLILMCASAAAYTGGLLGRTWIYLESQYAELSTGHVRQPYAEMGRRTFGSWMG